jgi:H+/Cl- antiporter ClcA
MGVARGSAIGLIVHGTFEYLNLSNTSVWPTQAYALVDVGGTLASACDILLTSILLLFA